MTKQDDILSNLRVASPCHVSWNRMTGDERVRFCDSCQLNVYNFSELTSQEIESLVLKSEGRVCGKMYRRADGTMITRDCPVGLRALRKQVARKATAILAAILSIGTAGFAQSKKDKSQCKEIPSVKIELEKISANTESVLRGKVTDPYLSMIPYAKVSIWAKSSKNRRIAMTDDTGTFAFEGLSAGEYKLKVEFEGFKSLEVKSIEIKDHELANVTLTLDVSGDVEVMGVIVTTPEYETSNGTTIIRGDLIRRFPIYDE